jgi:hypothetical protein
LQPEHEAQHSADAQHDLCAAFAVPVSPSAITAINRATFNVFIVFSFRSGKSYSHANAIVRTGRIQYSQNLRIFLNAKDVDLLKDVAAGLPCYRFAGVRVLENGRRCFNVDDSQNSYVGGC